MYSLVKYTELRNYINKTCTIPKLDLLSVRVKWAVKDNNMTDVEGVTGLWFIVKHAKMFFFKTEEKMLNF